MSSEGTESAQRILRDIPLQGEHMTRPRFAHKVNTAKRYVPAVATDISKTFRAERKRLAAQGAPGAAGYGHTLAEAPALRLGGAAR